MVKKKKSTTISPEVQHAQDFANQFMNIVNPTAAKAVKKRRQNMINQVNQLEKKRNGKR